MVYTYSGDCIMKKRFNLYVLLGIIFLALFLLLFALLFLDRANITGTGEVGLSSLNKLIDYKYNKAWQVIADIFLYLGICFVIGLVVVAFVQLIRRKSLFKVDRYLVIFGIFFALAIVLWLAFDKFIIINYRPIYHYDLEPSFPSTHTFIVIFVYLSMHGMAVILFDNKKIKYGTLIAAILISLIVSISRVLSGMHYITDVFGGIFLGLSLYFTCFGIIKGYKEEEIDE